MRAKPANLATSIALALAGAALTGCFGKSPDAGARMSQVQTTSGNGMETFRATIYAYTRVNCQSCHDIRFPQTASPDLKIAYAAAREKVNFSSLESSTLLRYVDNGHCGLSACLNKSSVLLPLLQQWKAAEENVGNTGGDVINPNDPNPIVTYEQPLPSNLKAFDPSSTLVPDEELANERLGNLFSRMVWDLGTMGPDFAGAKLEIWVQKFNTSLETDPELFKTSPGSYRFWVPRLATANGYIAIKDLRILVNGRYNRGGGSYADVDTTVMPQPYDANATYFRGFPFLSRALFILFQDRPLDADNRISLSFRVIRRADPTPCRDLATFRNVIQPQMSRLCVNCHGAPGFSFQGSYYTLSRNAYWKYPILGLAADRLEDGQPANNYLNDQEKLLSDDQRVARNCLQTAMRIGPDVASSPLITYPRDNLGSHPFLGTDAATQSSIYSQRIDANAWINWMKGETP